MYEQLIEFMDICIHVLRNNDVSERACTESLKFIADLSRFSYVEFDKVFDFSSPYFHEEDL